MRIVHTCLRYPPATGGVETYAKEIVERTRHVPDRDVRVLTSKMRTHGPITELEPDLLIEDPPYLQRLHHAATPFVSYPRLQALNYYLGHHQPEILHAYSFWYQPADVAARYAKRHNIPFIFHPMYYEHSTRRKFFWQTYKSTIGRQTFAQADVVVVISPHEQKLIEKAGLPVKKFELIPPGIDVAHYQARQPNIFAKHRINGNVMLSVGRIDHHKGLSDIIEALPELLKKHPDLQWVIIGEDFGAQTDLQHRAQKRGVSNHVHFLGKVNEPEKISALQHAALLVHPSHYEAFGIVLAESLACGTPVIARRVAAIPFVAPDNIAGHLFTTQTELIQSISSLLTDSDRRQKLGQSGQNHVSKLFSWDKSISKLITLYDELRRK